jgi:epoxyqueuosine reductase
MVNVNQPNELLQELSLIARELGFVGMGVSSIEPLTQGAEALDSWLTQEYHGEMTYMGNHPRRDDPTMMLDEAKTLLVVALPYDREDLTEPTSERPRGVIARYARGRDYHEVLREKLLELADRLTALLERPVISRPCVDTAPLLEREYAARAGIGFIAKNTMLIMPSAGSYVLLGELLLDIELPPSTPISPKCGQCTQCLDRCPTRAFVGPHILDARKCISYFTIELKGPIPREFRKSIGDHVFGCDICQEVCPFNASSKPRPGAPSLAPHSKQVSPDLVDLLTLTSGDYRRLVKNTAMRRTTRPQLMRNAAVALGNSGMSSVVPALTQALESNPYPLARGHIAWALGQLPSSESKQALEKALPIETDTWVREEIETALSDLEHTDG